MFIHRQEARAREGTHPATAPGLWTGLGKERMSGLSYQLTLYRSLDTDHRHGCRKSSLNKPTINGPESYSETLKLLCKTYILFTLLCYMSGVLKN